MLIGQEGADTIVYGVLDNSSGRQVQERFRLVNVDASTLVSANFEGRTIVRIEDQNLIGTTAADTIYGGFGDDVIDGGAGSDALYGSDGTDHLIGDDGSIVPSLPTIVGPASSSLVNTLGGPIGFGEAAQPRSDYRTDRITLPVAFNGGTVQVNGASVNNIYFDTDGYAELGGLKLTVFRANANPALGAGAASPGGNSTGSNQLWYDFDSTNNVITLTWDDVQNAYNAADPSNAFQVQIKVNGPDSFDVTYRFESLGYAPWWNSAAIQIGDTTFNLPMGNDYSYGAKLDTQSGNTGLPGLWAFAIRGSTIIDGLSEADTLDGGSGDDLLEGGIGNDTLTAASARIL